MNPLAFIITSMLGRTRATPEPAPTPVDPLTRESLEAATGALEPHSVTPDRIVGADVAPPHHGKTSTPWTLTLTDATGEALTLSPRCGMTIDRADCLIIDDPAPRSAPTAVGRGLSAKVMTSLKAIHANLLTTPGPASTWSRPAETERNPGAREKNAAKWARRAASRRQGA